MRLAFLIFEEKQTNNVVDFLDNYCDDSYGILPAKQWHIWAYEKKPSEDILCLDIDSHPLSENDFHMLIEDENSFELLLNMNNSVVWMVDICEQHDGSAELLDFIKAFLKEIPAAYVADDYTDHFWTYEELEKNLKVEGHTFFDCIGWYEEKIIKHRQ